MPQRNKVTEALRFLKKHPKIPAKGIRFIGQALEESEDEPGQTQKYLKMAHQRLQKESRTSPLLKNIRRLSTSIGKPER